MVTVLPNLRHQLTSGQRAELHRTVLALTDVIFPLLMERQGGRCAHCGVEDDAMDIDHIVYHPGVTLNELQLLCRDCHAEKHADKPIIRYAKKRRPRRKA